jgi:hypothetical protein
VNQVMPYNDVFNCDFGCRMINIDFTKTYF